MCNDWVGFFVLAICETQKKKVKRASSQSGKRVVFLIIASNSVEVYLDATEMNHPFHRRAHFLAINNNH